MGLLSREDLQQDYELELATARAEGRRPRPRRWVVADALRRAYGRNGGRRTYANNEERIARVADTTAPRAEPMQAALVERALRMALALPIDQRVELVLAIRCLAERSAVARVRAWLVAYPNRRATHAQIAADTGLRRETVTRTLVRLGAARRRTTTKGVHS